LNLGVGIERHGLAGVADLQHHLAVVGRDDDAFELVLLRQRGSRGHQECCGSECKPLADLHRPSPLVRKAPAEPVGAAG
jgi:hypothetical protein